jgi:CHAD domain-containing protein
MACGAGVAFAVKWDVELTVEQNARKRLPRVLAKFYAAGRKVQRHEAPATLHRFRLQGKRVRYTLELFRSVYGPGLGKLLKVLRKAQDALGAIQDCETANQTVPHAEFQSAMKAQQVRLKEEFRAYWTQEFDKPGQEQLWLRYLKTYARATVKTAPLARKNSQAAGTDRAARRP